VEPRLQIEAVRSEAVPSEAVPSEAVPSEAVPSEATEGPELDTDTSMSFEEEMERESTLDELDCLSELRSLSGA
jgi:hypothetical protein